MFAHGKKKEVYLEVFWPTFFQKNGMLVVITWRCKKNFGWILVEALLYGAFDFVIISVYERFSTADYSEIDYFVDVELEYTDISKNRTRFFP